MYPVPSKRPYLLARTNDKFIFVECALHLLSCQLHQSCSTVHGVSLLHSAHICRVLSENIDKLSINNNANAITHIVAAAVASCPNMMCLIGVLHATIFLTNETNCLFITISLVRHRLCSHSQPSRHKQNYQNICRLLVS